VFAGSTSTSNQRRHLEQALRLCRGILHAQQQAAQQNLGVRRLHFHLKAKTTFRKCFTTVPRHPARSAAGSPAASGCLPAPLPPQTKDDIQNTLYDCAEKGFSSHDLFCIISIKMKKLTFLHISN
jgi:hypothetical protein